MNRTTLKNFSIALLVLGASFPLLGVTAYYAEWTMVGLTGIGTVYPLRQLSGILLIAGTVSLILGLGFLWISKQETNQ